MRHLCYESDRTPAGSALYWRCIQANKKNGADLLWRIPEEFDFQTRSSLHWDDILVSQDERSRKPVRGQ